MYQCVQITYVYPDIPPLHKYFETLHESYSIVLHQACGINGSSDETPLAVAREHNQDTQVVSGLIQWK